MVYGNSKKDLLRLFRYNVVAKAQHIIAHAIPLRATLEHTWLHCPMGQCSIQYYATANG